MNTKEIEQLTGLNRANIRFYETEGLINPSRGKNGYRYYSSEDLETLKKIKLFRSMHFSITDIKQLINHEISLYDSLDNQMKILLEEKDNIDKSYELCQQIKKDSINFKSLDADKYLNYVKASDQIEELKIDRIEYCNRPIRRYLARRFDNLFYITIWFIFIFVIFKMNIFNQSKLIWIIHGLLATILSVILEPVFLKCFATTPGKWLLGLYVYDNQGKKLTFIEGLEREFSVFIYGYGGNLWMIGQYCLVNSYISCTNSQPNYWEYDSNVIYKEPNISKYILYILAPFICIGSMILSYPLVNIPKNIHNLTIKEFAQNYNHYIKNAYIDEDINAYVVTQTDDYNSISYECSNIGAFKLTQDGKWNIQSPLYKDINNPNLVFETDGKNITKISYEYAQTNIKEAKKFNTGQVKYFMMSFVNAQIGYNPYSDEFNDFIKEFESYPLKEFDVTYHNIHIQLTIDSDLEIDEESEYIIPNKEENSLKIIFSMEKVD